MDQLPLLGNLSKRLQCIVGQCIFANKLNKHEKFYQAHPIFVLNIVSKVYKYAGENITMVLNPGLHGFEVFYQVTQKSTPV